MSEFLSLSTTDISNPMILCCEGCPMQGGTFSGISSLSPPDARSTYSSGCDHLKYHWTLPVSQGKVIKFSKYNKKIYLIWQPYSGCTSPQVKNHWVNCQALCLVRPHPFTHAITA